MLDSWQGWWTGAYFDDDVREFVWSSSQQVVARDSSLWTFRSEPYNDTCIWVMQPPSFDYTWGNYECVTKSGYICEIALPSYKRDSK